MVLGGSGQIKLDAELFDVRPLDAIRVAPAVGRAIEAGAGGLEFQAFGPITAPTARRSTIDGSNDSGATGRAAATAQ